MAHAHRQDAWKDQLWNVSLLPLVQVSQSAPPPIGPAPAGGSALTAAAVLSVCEQAPLADVAEAA